MFNLFKKQTPHPYVGRKIKCIEMVDEPFPIPNGTIGEVYNVGFDVINVKWNNGRNIGLIVDLDKYEFINEENKTNND